LRSQTVKFAYGRECGKSKARDIKGYQNPKRKLRVTAHYYIKFGKKMPYILCILKPC